MSRNLDGFQRNYHDVLVLITIGTDYLTTRLSRLLYLHCHYALYSLSLSSRETREESRGGFGCEFLNTDNVLSTTGGSRTSLRGTKLKTQHNNIITTRKDGSTDPSVVYRILAK